jgi:eukaryotic-like serine/threonine-protein kinase
MPEPTEPGEPIDIFAPSTGIEAESFLAPTKVQPPAPVPKGRLRPGERLGDFIILRELGRGAFATVFLAHEVTLDRRVALKVSENRGLGEGQALAELQHQHIVQVFAQFTDSANGKHCLSLQYVPGTTLAGIIDHLHTGGIRPALGQQVLEAIGIESQDEIPFDPAGIRNRQTLAASDFAAAVCWIGVQMAEALAFAHGRGVLHCDIKPANVLVNPYGEPLLADFNVAIEKHRIDTSVGGTLAYMSPEQLALFLKVEGHTDIDARSDIYSLGVVLFEFLTGRLPFESADSAADRFRQSLRQRREFSSATSILSRVIVMAMRPRWLKRWRVRTTRSQSKRGSRPRAD